MLRSSSPVILVELKKASRKHGDFNDCMGELKGGGQLLTPGAILPTTTALLSRGTWPLLSEAIHCLKGRLSTPKSTGHSQSTGTCRLEKLTRILKMAKKPTNWWLMAKMAAM
jgi:hypothetical protein